MKKQLIRNLQVGDEVETQVLVLECSRGNFSAPHRAGEYFLKLNLGDVSGSIKAILWDTAALKELPQKGDVIFVRGEVGDYYGPQVVINDCLLYTSAYRIGLADHLVPPGEALTRARAIAEKILKRGPVAVRLAKKAVNRGLEQTMTEGCKTEAQLFALLCDTEDQKEGAMAFLEKRPPVFQGK